MGQPCLGQMDSWKWKYRLECVSLLAHALQSQFHHHHLYSVAKRQTSSLPKVFFSEGGGLGLEHAHHSLLLFSPSLPL